jgi:hypothetical protein
MSSMAKSKATVTLDKEKLEKASAFVGGRSMSEVIDVALDRLIKAEQLRHDVQAYIKQPLTDEELAAVDMQVELDLGDDDVDYEAIYGLRG